MNNKAIQLLVAVCLAMTSVSCDESQHAPDAESSKPADAIKPLETNKPADTIKPADTSTPVVTSKPAPSPPAGPITIVEPGFEADGTWKFGKSGANVKGFFGKAHAEYIDADLIDPVPDRGTIFTYNNGTQHDLYQVLTATLAANTVYTLSIVAIDPRIVDPFPGGELRLGYLTESPTAADDYGVNLLKPTKVVNPVPFNDKVNDPKNQTDGFATWTYNFVTGAKPAGLGQKLRIEVLGGGSSQTLFDNVRLEARAAAPSNSTSEASSTEHAEVPLVVVMLGDSTTDRGMPTAVMKQLNKGINILNAGKGGDNATSALDRLEQDVLAHHPDIVTVSFGLNDAGGRKPDQFKKSLKQIIKTLRDADIRVVLMTSTPFDNTRHGWGKGFEAEGGLDEYMDKEFCEKMRSLADDEGVLLCDLHAIFKQAFKEDADLINKVICPDGVHLTADGYLLAAKHITPVLHKLLADRK